MDDFPKRRWDDHVVSLQCDVAALGEYVKGLADDVRELSGAVKTLCARVEAQEKQLIKIIAWGSGAFATVGGIVSVLWAVLNR